jgi:lipid-A-disaccharide synthase
MQISQDPSANVEIGVSGRPLRIGIVASEVSGDLLGARLIRDIKGRRPGTRFEGVAGPQMLQEGCHSLLPMERLSVMGLVEIVRHLPELLSIRARLVRHFRDDPPDVYIGVDAPAMNVGLSARLHRFGISTVQYVSPTVWAWRPGRVKALRRAVDLVLSIYPFEEEYLRRHQVSAVYVGHPLAAEVPMEPDRDGARGRLGFAPGDTVIALLPGSRRNEVKILAADFIEAALRCHAYRSDLKFAVPLVNAAVRGLFENALRNRADGLDITLVDANSRDVLSAADLVLTASGTATIEALLHKRPMVVAYRVNPLTYAIARTFNLVKIPYVAMANLLAGEELAPEFIQDACRPERLAGALLDFLEAPARVAEIQTRYRKIHEELQGGVTTSAADAVLELIGLE